MRVAVVDIGTNSTRLLIADVGEQGVEELVRRSMVTRLGEGVEASGRLGDAPQQRVFETLADYADAIDEAGCERRAAVMTSAVRDAANGTEFAAAVAERFGLDGRTLSGDEEARLTYLGATAARDPGDPTPLVVADIGGGSTELVTGRGAETGFHVSTQVGVVRHTERHFHHDPPRLDELEALAEDARATFAEAVPAGVREATRAAIAVAGTATSAAAIDLGAWDPEGVEGRKLTRAVLEAQLGRLAAVPVDDRRRTPGLHPDRAPTIVAGLVILLEVLRAFGLHEVEVSDRDILWGVALETAQGAGEPTA